MTFLGSVNWHMLGPEGNNLCCYSRVKAVITVHYKNSFNEHIFTIETKEDARINASEIKVIQPKASKILLSFLCIFLLQSRNKVTSRRFLVGCGDC